MGGFTLEGPTYRFRSLPDSFRCRCTGFKGRITSDIEAVLRNKEDKKLSLSDLPEDMQSDMLKHHLGENFYYTVEKHTFTYEEYTNMKPVNNNDFQPFSWNDNTNFSSLDADNSMNLYTYH